MSADSAASAASPAVLPPVPQRAAIAILGSMVLLIVGLIGILVQTTWVNPASASEAPTVETEHLPG